MFGQVKEWLTLALHEMIRVLHVVACLIVLILLYCQGWQGGVFKVVKNDHFLVFSSVFVHFPKFLGRLRSSFC